MRENMVGKEKFKEINRLLNQKLEEKKGVNCCS